MRRTNMRGSRRQAFAQAAEAEDVSGGTMQWVLEYDNDWTQETATSVDLNADVLPYTDRFGVEHRKELTGGGLDTWTITPADGVRGIKTAAAATDHAALLDFSLTQLFAAVGVPAYRKTDDVWLVTDWADVAVAGIFCNVSHIARIRDAGDATITEVRSRRDASFGGGADGFIVIQYDFSAGFNSSAINPDPLSAFSLGTQVTGSMFQAAYSAGPPADDAEPDDQTSLIPADRLWLPPKPFDSNTGDIDQWADHSMAHGFWEAFNLGSVDAKLMRTRVYRWRA